MVTGLVPHVGGPITLPGAPTVLIGNLPAARVGDMATCVGPPDFIAPPGAPTVLISGRPAARMGDMTVHGGRIVIGCFTVLIGNSGGGGGNTLGNVGTALGTALNAVIGPEPLGGCLRTAKDSNAAFIKVGPENTPKIESNTYKQKPTVAELSRDPLVDSELKKAWIDSNPNAPEVPKGQPGSLKKEQGGWIVWKKDTGKLEVIRVAPGSRDGLGTIVGTRPKDSTSQEVVGWFHTHPNTSNEGYTHGPSIPDKNFQRLKAKAPGIIETHEGRKTIPYP